MGSLISKKGETPEASVEFWPDKVVKYAVITPLVLLAIIAIIVLYAVDKVNCKQNLASDIYPMSEVNEYCWHNPQPASMKKIVNYTIYNNTVYYTSPPPNGTTVTYNSWVEGPALIRHKIFPILLLCECVCLAIPLLIWYWCIGNEQRSHTKALAAHANSLTAAYKKYDHSQSKADEASVHRELDNYLEYLSYLLSSKAQRIFILHLVKWIIVLVICVAWFAGNLGLFSPDFVIFQDSFKCLYDKANSLAYECYFTTSMFLRVVWYINIVVLGILIILILLYIIVGICWPRRYEKTYFHGSIPGTMDRRLSRTIQRNYNSRHYWLLSKMCEENETLLADPGLAKSLARKYGDNHNGPDQKGDNSEQKPEEKPACVKQNQVDRFQKTADDCDKSSPLCCGPCLGSGSSGEHSGKQRPHESTLRDPSNQGRHEPDPVIRQHNNIGPKQSVTVTELTPRKQLDHTVPNGQVVENGEVQGNGRVQETVPVGHLNQRNPERNSMDPSTDFTPEHLYFRELIRYKHPKGINPEYPVDHKPAQPFNQQQEHPHSYPYNIRNGSPSKTRIPYETEPAFDDHDYPKSVSVGEKQPAAYSPWKSPRTTVFSFPRRLKRGHVKKRRIASVSAQDPDVIVLEDIEEYIQADRPPRKTESHNDGHSPHYPSPYSGPLSSRIIMPYYDADTGTYTDLNPLAYKLRKTVRKQMAKDAKVWRP